VRRVCLCVEHRWRKPLENENLHSKSFGSFGQLSQNPTRNVTNLFTKYTFTMGTWSFSSVAKIYVFLDSHLRDHWTTIVRWQRIVCGWADFCPHGQGFTQNCIFLFISYTFFSLSTLIYLCWQITRFDAKSQVFLENIAVILIGC